MAGGCVGDGVAGVSAPVVTLAHLAEMVEAARVIYMAGKDAGPADFERLLHAYCALSWRVEELQQRIPVEVAP